MPTPTPPPSAPSTPAAGLPKAYAPADTEPAITARWDAAKAFHADPARVLSGAAKPYCIFIPPPNVTAALHLGHALNNTLQDVLIRAHRMRGYETLWMPGTDHAGIATQAVVEKRVLKEEGKRRSDFTREEFIGRIQAFKDEYEATITQQLKDMGCSCDWDRQRFTMDDQCAAAVREAFFILFRDGLIYRGKRLVNWDPVLQTAVADDECYDAEVNGQFYYLRYPLVSKGDRTDTSYETHRSSSPVTWAELSALGYPGAADHPPESQAFVTVATTRPETYLGDTAVALNPKDPRAHPLRGLHAQLPLIGRIIPIIEDAYVVLPAAMQADPEEAKADPKAAYATGFLKVTPAHDKNDWEIGQRHGLEAINIMAPDASISATHGWSNSAEHAGAAMLIGQKREMARKLVVKEFEALGLFEGAKPYTHNILHSDRSKAVIEPYLSDQWYVRVTDPRLAAAANNALVPEQRTTPLSGNEPTEESSDPAVQLIRTAVQTSRTTVQTSRTAVQPVRTAVQPDRTAVQPIRTAVQLDRTAVQLNRTAVQVSRTGEGMNHGAEGTTHGAEGTDHSAPRTGDAALTFHPARYAKTYELWHENIRDWCISRQLWWGHRIPVWSVPTPQTFTPEAASEHGRRAGKLFAYIKPHEQSGRVILKHSGVRLDTAESKRIQEESGGTATYDQLRHLCQKVEHESLGTFVCVREPDGEDREIVVQLEALGLRRDTDVLDTWFSSALWPLSTVGWPDPARFPGNEGMLDAFNPSSVLCTAREIITLWVSRMVMFNRYFRGLPGAQGCTNPPPNPLPLGGGTGTPAGSGAVPFRDVFIHAMIQDGEGRKMSKSLGNGVDPRDIIASHGSDAMRFTLVGMTTNTQDVRLPVRHDPKTGRNTSEKFDAGRNYCNKLWNTARFVLEKLGKAGSHGPSAISKDPGTDYSLLDRWMLSRLAATVKAVDASLAAYEFSDYAEAMYKLLWWDLCDWYLEGVKPTVEANPAQGAVLAHALEVIVRLLHPITPFITESIWEHLKNIETAPIQGVHLGPSRTAGLLATAGWPEIAESWIDPEAEAAFERLRELVNAIRNIRSEHQVPPKRRITLHATPAALAVLATAPGLVETLAGLEKVEPITAAPAGVAFRAGGEELALSNLADAAGGGGGELASTAETDRLTRQLADLRKTETTIATRLANPGYAQRAPAKLVEESKAQLAAAQTEIAAIEARLKGPG